MKMKKKVKNSLLSLLLLLTSSCGLSSNSTEIESSCRVISYYDYTKPVPESETVDESYYDITLFAGDSRMGSLSLYGTHENANVAYVTSLNLLLIDSMQVDEHEEEITLYDILASTTMDNIYLLFGVNEIRNKNFIAFGEKYQEIITMLLENNPNRNIYIILSYHPDYISDLPEPELTEHLEDLNGTLKDLAIKNHVYYLDPDLTMDDELGTIKDEYVADGLHFTSIGTQVFEELIATHTVRSDTYVKEICE